MNCNLVAPNSIVYVDTVTVTANSAGDFLISDSDYRGNFILQIANGDFSYSGVAFTADLYRTDGSGNYYVHTSGISTPTANASLKITIVSIFQ